MPAPQFMRRGGGGGGLIGGPPTTQSAASVLADPALRTTTDTETATQATGKTITLPTPGKPLYIITFANGSTGRFQILLPNGETMEFHCLTNAPPQLYMIPAVFSTLTTKLIFSVITIDNAAAGNVIGASIVYRPLEA